MGEKLLAEMTDGVARPFYVPELNGLRGVACAIVLASHVSVVWVPGGWVGVDLFFVLSGYLITSVLLREHKRAGRISLSKFYFRRLLRLGPPLLFMLIIYCGLWVGHSALSSKQQEHDLVPVVYSLLYISDWVMAFDLGDMWGLAHTWSLGVEEQFYLIWPLLIILLVTFLPSKRLLVITCLIAIIVTWRVFLVLDGAGATRTFYAFDTRADTVLIGCALAMWLSNERIGLWSIYAARLSPYLLAALTVLTFTLNWKAPTVNAFGFSIIALLCAAIIVAAMAQAPNMIKACFGWPPLIYLGVISYGVYLWHFPINMVLSSHLQRIALLFGTASASTAMAAFSYHVIERPFLRLKLRYSTDQVLTEEMLQEMPPRRHRFFSPATRA